MRQHHRQPSARALSVRACDHSRYVSPPLPTRAPNTGTTLMLYIQAIYGDFFQTMPLAADGLFIWVLGRWLDL
jgi:hypothetical protein